jgi:hypothetical protein
MKARSSGPDSKPKRENGPGIDFLKSGGMIITLPKSSKLKYSYGKKCGIPPEYIFVYAVSMRKKRILDSTCYPKSSAAFLRMEFLLAQG